MLTVALEVLFDAENDVESGSTAISASAIRWIFDSKQAQKTAGFYSPLLRIQSAV